MKLSPSIHKFDDELIYSGLSAVRQAHRPELIEGLSEHLINSVHQNTLPYLRIDALSIREAGFDYLEILGCTGYLFSQSLFPLTIKSTDEYGGPFENRMRLGIEVITIGDARRPGKITEAVMTGFEAALSI